jgi:HAD superfamily hydrolase (TIGR01509 family)
MTHSGIQQKKGVRRRRETVLFDQDGVIAASQIKKSEAHVETVLRMGGTNSEELTTLFADVIGLSYEKTRDRYLQCGMIAVGPEVNNTYRALYRSIYSVKIKEVELTAGALSLLEGIARQGYRIGLVSSAHSEEVSTILGRHGIDQFFDIVVTAESVDHHKPAPDPYLKALAALGLQEKPHLAVVFEDTRAGIIAARAAGLRVIAVRHPLNQRQDFSEADRIIDSLAEGNQILAVIETFLSGYDA